MATLADDPGRRRRSVDQDHRFFLISAIIMAFVLVLGFSTQLMLGRSSFSVPLLYHVHAFVFFGWVVLYVAQTALVAAGSVRLHRTLGWLAVGWIPAMLFVGTSMTIVSARRGAPFFFDVNEFLFGNPAQLLGFATLAVAAIVMRRRTAWHRRLMSCGMALLTGPGFGRLLPMPLLIPWAWWISFLVTQLFPVAGMIADRRRSGRIHPAWYYGLAAAFFTQLIGDAIAYSPAGRAIAESVIAGTPGAARPKAAHFP